MAEVRIEHIYNCSEDTFWDKIFFEADYNERLFKDALQFPEYNVVSSEDTDTQVKRVIDVVPKLGPMPGPVKKLIGDGLGYREEGVFDKKTKRYTVKITPNKMADKMTTTGEMWCEPAGDGKVKRIYKGVVVAKIFGVGGMVEKNIIGDMEKSYEIGAKFTNEYIAEKGL